MPSRRTRVKPAARTSAEKEASSRMRPRMGRLVEPAEAIPDHPRVRRIVLPELGRA